MASTFRNITVDSADAHALAWFWAQALGWHVYFDDDPEVLVAPSFPHVGDGATMLFIPVPEGKTAKNRMHLDLQPSDRTRDEEVERLAGLGASVVEDHRTPEGLGWVWMADPEGNEFCVERGTGERANAPSRRYRIDSPTD
jgi:predicted enzyme related to lactoylglutathione lyase